MLWADSRSANLGVRVLAHGMGELARRAWGQEARVDFQDFGVGDSETGFGGKAILRDVANPHGPLKRKLRDYDFILDSGAGDSFADIYGARRLATMNYAHRVAARSRIPMAMGPQTIGPFETRLGRALARSSLRQMGVVVARDSTSASVSASAGRAVDALSTDVVFALPPPAVATGDRGRDVVLNVSGLLWRDNPHVDARMYRANVRELCHGLLEMGRQITLLPHVLDNPSHDNDIPPLAELRREFGDLVDVSVPGDLDDARRILAGARLVIGSRMHSCLNALSVQTPAISWAYSRKFAPLMADIGWRFGLDLRSEPHPARATLELVRIQPEEHLKAALGTVLLGTEKRLESARQALVQLSPRHPVA